MKAATVSLVQSEIRDASCFEYPEIRAMVREAVFLAGGFSGIVRDGDTVILKPNIVATRCNAGFTFLDFNAYRSRLQISAEVNGITTDYRVTKAVAELVRELNPKGKVLVVEGSAWGDTEKNFELMGYTMQNMPDVDRFISLDNTSSFASVESDDLVAVKLAAGRYPTFKMPRYTDGAYYLDRTCFEADVFISIPVLKNHLYAGVTGGIKNVAIGCTPCMVYGKSPERTARIRKIDHSWSDLNDWIHDYYLCRPVDFVVTDGLQGSQYGPRAQGTGSVKSARMNMRLILAGKDAVAVDTVHSCIVGTDPEKVDHLRELVASGAGVGDTKFITVKGNRRVDEVRKDFKLSRILAMIYRGRQAKYTDFNPPVFDLIRAAITGGRLIVDMEAAAKTTKIELYIDGKLHETIHDGFNHIESSLGDNTPKDPNEVVVCAYDRYLNCSSRKVNLSSGDTAA